jgi:anti-sigma factor RsiW
VKMDRFHPADDRLIAAYFGDEEASEGDRRTVRQHLHGCEACTWRYTELTAPLERLRRDAASEADEVFTAARLDAQCTKILDRLEDRAHASRVVPFPSASTRLGRPVIHRPLMRWVAAAAAAGLLVGVMAGRLLEFGKDRTVPSTSVARTAPIARVSPGLAISGPVGTDSTEADEAMITEIELAARSQRIPALAVLDEMTPHLRQDAVLVRAMR